MKTRLFLLVAALATGSQGAAYAALDPAPLAGGEVPPPQVGLSVVVPASLNPSWTNSVAGTLAGIVESDFAKNGYAGELALIDANAPLPRTMPTLEIELVDWRVTPSGFISCIFHATLVAPEGEQDLGLCSGVWSAALRSADGIEPFEAAANIAIDNLYVELRELDLLTANIRW